MDYFFSQIILDLQARITAELPEIKYIDQDLGQLGQVSPEERPPISYPAILIDFPNSDYSNLSGGAQLGAVPISFQLIFAPFSQTWQNAPDLVKKKGLEYLETEQKLHKALQNWSLDYFSPLVRVSVKSQNNNDIGLRVRHLIYSTEYEDYSTIDETSEEVTFSFNGGLKTN